MREHSCGELLDISNILGMKDIPLTGLALFDAVECKILIGTYLIFMDIHQPASKWSAVVN